MSLDVSLSVLDCWFRLGFLNAAELNAGTAWVTPAELYQFADDAVKGIARSTALFLVYDQTTNVVAGTPQYALPANHVFTESAFLIYAGPLVQLLRLTGATQLFALDATWPATSGPPVRLSMDAADIHAGVLYPNPVANAVLAMVLEVYPPDVTVLAHVLPVTGILQDACSYAMLAGALAKESDNSRPEVAKHCRERMGLYLAIADKLWGVD
jgi:hypothetical protein